MKHIFHGLFEHIMDLVDMDLGLEVSILCHNEVAVGNLDEGSHYTIKIDGDYLIVDLPLNVEHNPDYKDLDNGTFDLNNPKCFELACNHILECEYHIMKKERVDYDRYWSNLTELAERKKINGI